MEVGSVSPTAIAIQLNCVRRKERGECVCVYVCLEGMEVWMVSYRREHEKTETGK